MGQQLRYEGRYLSFLEQDGWEYASRATGANVALLIPVTDDGHIVLVEQYRIPVKAPVLELPAGLVGDVDSSESVEGAARRELEEETGYFAHEMSYIAKGPVSAGLSDEIMHMYLATSLEKRGNGGGDASEDITVQHMPVQGWDEWLRARLQGNEPLQIDIKIFSALRFAEQAIAKNQPRTR